MKIKLTVYLLASDTRHDGTSVQAFGTKEERDRALLAIMIEHEGDQMLKELIAAKDLDGAWSHWQEDLVDPMNTYAVEEQEVEFEWEEPWQPISTLDRTKTQFVMVSDGHIVRLQIWNRQGRWEAAYGTGCEITSNYEGVYNPTHWMECPELPKQ